MKLAAINVLIINIIDGENVTKIHWIVIRNWCIKLKTDSNIKVCQKIICLSTVI